MNNPEEKRESTDPPIVDIQKEKLFGYPLRIVGVSQRKLDPGTLPARITLANNGIMLMSLHSPRLPSYGIRTNGYRTIPIDTYDYYRSSQSSFLSSQPLEQALNAKSSPLISSR